MPNDKLKESSKEKLGWLYTYLIHELKTFPELERPFIAAAIASKNSMGTNDSISIARFLVSSQIFGTPNEMLTIWKKLSLDTVAAVSNEYSSSQNESKKMAVIAELLPLLKMEKSEKTSHELPIGNWLNHSIMDLEAERCYRVASAICKAYPHHSVSFAVQKTKWNLPVDWKGS